MYCSTEDDEVNGNLKETENISIEKQILTFNGNDKFQDSIQTTELMDTSAISSPFESSKR